MNKSELITAMAERAELSKKDTEKALKAFVDVISDELVKGEKIQIVGFGTFEVVERKEREGKKPVRMRSSPFRHPSPPSSKPERRLRTR